MMMYVKLEEVKPLFELIKDSLHGKAFKGLLMRLGARGINFMEGLTRAIRRPWMWDI